MEGLGATAEQSPSPGENGQPSETSEAKTLSGEMAPKRGAVSPADGNDSPMSANMDRPRVRVDARLLEATLLNLRKRIAAIPLVFDIPGADEVTAERAKLLSQIDDYLLPRIRQSAAPLLVALVGSTGAGKSTLVKLVARFYDVTRGSVLIDGTDVRDYDLPAYRQQLGVVSQEPYLFAGTVRDAIAYGRPDASDAEVEAAARGVGAIEMICRLPGGFRHEVAERGRNLAAGQRQLIALARAYLVDPAILLLDEATAALDLAAEAAVNRATEQLAARRTTLVVAHRLTTAAKADRIVVLADGRIAESGTHDELLALGGSYAGMWAAFTGAAELAAEVPAR